MTLTERHVINKNNSLYPFLDDLCFKAKNLYNATVYRIRQEYFTNKKYLGYYILQGEFQNLSNPDYRALPAHAAQQVMRLVDQNFKAFFAAKKAYYNNSSGFTGRPKLPKYLDKDGRFVVNCAFGNGISKKVLKKEEKIRIIGTNVDLVKTKQNLENIKQVRIVPKGNWICIEVIYEIPDVTPLKDNRRYAAIDLGVNNLMTVTTNIKKEQPIVYSGRSVKSWNRYYNKEVAKSKSKLKKGQYTSNKIKKLGQKREFKISDYFHKTSRDLANYLVSRNISTLIIGNNQGWKQNTSLGKNNNQNFVQIPFYKLIQKLEYKCKLVGISVQVISEEYTSKCSFLDLEKLKKHGKYRGIRLKRGLFKTWKRRIINADVNGSFNILRKCKPNAFDDFIVNDNGIEGVVVHPLVKRSF